jgi:hypothetical protein
MARHDTPFFPRKTVAWTAEEPPPLRRLSLSLVQMAVLAGILLRCYRALIYGPGSTSFFYLFSTVAVGAIFLFGMVTLHLANYTIRHWLWRAPAFAALASAAEMLTSLALITLNREWYGSAHATFDNWLSLSITILQRNLIAISLFALVLAGVVQVVRFALLKQEHRDSMATAIHAEHERAE